MKGWGQLNTEERVDRLRKVVILIGLLVAMVAALSVLVAIMELQEDDKPASPKKVEQTVDHNNEA